MNNYIIREIHPGEASLAVHFYYKIFEQQFQFYPSTEAYFLHAAGQVFDDPANKLWVAADGDKIIGTISVIKTKDGEGQLRLFGTDISRHGEGIGTALMDTAMEYCRSRKLHHIILWTIDICKDALKLYAKYGFHMTDTKPNTTWAAYPMTEELWEYESTR